MTEIVYFIKAGDKIKIGKTTLDGLSNRIDSIQTGNPYRLELLGYLHGGIDVEKSMHDRFCEHRVNGEWFEHHKDIAEFIEKEKVPDGFSLQDSIKQKDVFDQHYRFALKTLHFTHARCIKYANDKCPGFLSEEDLSDALDGHEDIKFSKKIRLNEAKEAIDAIINVLSKCGGSGMSIGMVCRKTRAVRNLTLGDRRAVFDRLRKEGRIVAMKNGKTITGEVTSHTKYRIAGLFES